MLNGGGVWQANRLPVELSLDQQMTTVTPYCEVKWWAGLYPALHSNQPLQTQSQPTTITSMCCTRHKKVSGCNLMNCPFGPVVDTYIQCQTQTTHSSKSKGSLKGLVRREKCGYQVSRVSKPYRDNSSSESHSIQRIKVLVVSGFSKQNTWW